MPDWPSGKAGSLHLSIAWVRFPHWAPVSGMIDMKKRWPPIYGIILAVVVSLILWGIVFFAYEAFAQEVSGIILEEPEQSLILDTTSYSAVDYPEIALDRPPEEDIRDRIELGGFEDVIDMGDNWNDDCKINLDDSEILKCRVSW